MWGKEASKKVQCRGDESGSRQKKRGCGFPKLLSFARRPDASMAN